MHDDCLGHWNFCVIDFKNSHIQILDSLRLKTLISKIWIHCDQKVGTSSGLRVSKQWLNFVKRSSNCMT
ncbi:unnamed protein product, partial [Vitis vinifera]|uniref:Uncharacterized protein n=1 Tax=Vitis vinifera TaxID=29760 RepID=D7TKR5_VITVI